MAKKNQLKASIKKRAKARAATPRKSLMTSKSATSRSRKHAVRAAQLLSNKRKTKRTARALEPLAEGVFVSQGLVFDYEAIERAREHAHAAA